MRNTGGKNSTNCAGDRSQELPSAFAKLRLDRRPRFAKLTEEVSEDLEGGPPSPLRGFGETSFAWLA